MASRTLTLVSRTDDREHKVEIADDGRARIGEASFEVHAEGGGVVAIAGERTTRCWTVASGNTRWVFLEGRVYELSEQAPEARVRRGAHAGSLSAPMPATVRRILVTEGDIVKPGDSLIVLEAMKMELPIRSAVAAKVKAVKCREGELVQPGVTLVELDDVELDDEPA